MDGYGGEQDHSQSWEGSWAKPIVIFRGGSHRKKKKKNVTVDEEGAVQKAPAIKFNATDNVRA